MATYYVDPNASGNDDGTSWTDAWSTLQRAIDGTNGTQPVAGDIVYCRNSGAGSGETLSAAVDVDGNSGNSSSGFIKFIGTNGSGTVDGTKYVLDANSTATNCLATFSASHIWFENFQFTGATSHGITLESGGDQPAFVSCEVDNNGGYGIYATFDSSNGFLIRTSIHNNTNSGCGSDLGAGWRQFLCAFYNNGDNGYMGASNSNLVFLKCIFHDNGDNDTHLLDPGGIIVENCIFDGTDQSNETGLDMAGDLNFILANRLTNLSTGFSNANLSILGFNLFHNNTTDISNSTVIENIGVDSDTDSNEYDPDADDGYNDVSTNDFNLKSSRTYNGDGNDVVGMGIGS